jgi:hypothetical protein
VGVLQTCVPTDGERNKAAALAPVAVAALSDAEAFVAALTEVPQLPARLRAIRHAFQMEVLLEEAKDTLAAHVGICREVRRRQRDGVERVGSHGRWKRPCLQTAHMTI